MYLYYALAAISIWLGLQSLLSGIRFSSYVRRECKRPLPQFTPYISVIAPFRGRENGLKQNLAALFAQDYPEYEIIFVTDSDSDPSVATVRELADSLSQQRIQTKILFAGNADDSGQKVHNLRRAVIEVDTRSEALVFVDVDARPASTWLRSLVAPLQNDNIGAATGYRWFLADRRNLSSQLLSVWNASIASALGGQSDRNFCWGGSTAIRRTTFENLSIREQWRGTVSDDFTVMRVMREAKLPIKFVPACLTPSIENYNFAQLIEFTTRQLKITRVYAPQFWKASLIGGIIFNLVFFGGIALLAARIALGYSTAVLLVLLGIVFLLGACKSYIRWRAVRIPLRQYDKQMKRSLIAHVFLWPLAALLFLYNTLVAGFSRKIVWRGIGYELKSPNEAVIIFRE